MNAVDRFTTAAAEVGLDPAIQRFPEGTRTAVDAAAAVGCAVGQIVKSLVFSVDGSPILILTSGANQVDTGLMSELLGARLEKADAAVVREATGFAIGGTPPLGHATPLRTLLDEDLLTHDEVWAAAGTPDTCFPIAPGDLATLTGAEVVAVRHRTEGDIDGNL
ncbi:MAG: YbaK/EbsC family protein [Actinomycetota bacterium]